MQILLTQNRLASPTNIVQDKKMSHSSVSLKNSLTSDTFQRQETGKVSFKGDLGEGLGGAFGFLAGAVIGGALVVATGGAATPLIIASLGSGIAGGEAGRRIGEKL